MSTRRSVFIGSCLFPFVWLVSVTAAQDASTHAGKMWTFEYPPFEQVQEAYAFRPDSSWFDNARLGALRIAGCSGALVSGSGLLVTSYRCVRSHVTAAAREGENLSRDGFQAGVLQDERPAPGVWADQLLLVRDITGVIMEASISEDERTAVKERLKREVGVPEVHVELVSLYDGARISAYVYRRYEDIRLVLAPASQIGSYGGVSDNATYPRYSLDVAFFRVYEDGHPLETENYFAFSDTRIMGGDVVFAIGNPGSTARLETVAQFESRRDVWDPIVRRFLGTRIAALDSIPDPRAEELRFDLLNAAKLYTGRKRALEDTLILHHRATRKRRLEQAAQEAHGDLFAKMADLQDARAGLEKPAGAFYKFLHPRYESSILRRAAALHRGEAGAHAIENRGPELERALLIARFRDMEAWLGPDDPVTQQFLAGRAPEVAADRLLEASTLASAERMAAASDSARMQDVVVHAMVIAMERRRAFDDASRALRVQEQEVARALGRLRFETYGARVPPDATHTLRISDGVVRGYAYNGTVAPPVTTYYGLLDHFRSYGENSEWTLPSGWQSLPDAFDLSTPLNFVSTVDITEGNAGSPLVNRDLEIVGIAMDTNIEGLSGDFIYWPERNRCVAVATNGILEALDKIYGAERLVVELQTETLAPPP